MSPLLAFFHFYKPEVVGKILPNLYLFYSEANRFTIGSRSGVNILNDSAEPIQRYQSNEPISIPVIETTHEEKIAIARDKARAMLKDGDQLINSKSIRPADHIKYAPKLKDDGSIIPGKFMEKWGLDKNKIYDANIKSDFSIASRHLEYLCKINGQATLYPNSKTHVTKQKQVSGLIVRSYN